MIANAPALTRDRLSRVDQHYLGSDSYAAANAVLIEVQSTSDLSQAWGVGWSPPSTGCGSSCRPREQAPPGIP